MKTWLTALCACLALGLVPAGCGDDDDEGSGAAAATAPSEQPADKPADEPDGGASAEGVTVSMKDITFTPRDVKVPKGGTITWTNEDSLEHDVTKTSGPGEDFKSGKPGGLAPGDTYSKRFNTAGNIRYQCTVHPGMKGTITVR
jgi:plastocyanin